MIEFLRNWCEELIVGVFLIIIIEMFVPNGNIKKYVKVISGIYIIFIILNPILSNLGSVDLNEIFSNSEVYAEENFESSQDELQNLYAKAIENEIENEFSNIEDVRVEFTEDLTDIEKIEIKLLEEDGRSNEIKEYIANNYNIASGRIVWLTN